MGVSGGSSASFPSIFVEMDDVEPWQTVGLPTMVRKFSGPNFFTPTHAGIS